MHLLTFRCVVYSLCTVCFLSACFIFYAIYGPHQSSLPTLQCPLPTSQPHSKKWVQIYLIKIEFFQNRYFVKWKSSIFEPIFYSALCCTSSSRSSFDLHPTMDDYECLPPPLVIPLSIIRQRMIFRLHSVKNASAWLQIVSLACVTNISKAKSAHTCSLLYIARFSFIYCFVIITVFLFPCWVRQSVSVSLEYWEEKSWW